MNSVDTQYKELLKHILSNGVKKQDRTGTGTLSVFDYSMRFNMKEGFPLLTSKKMFTKGVIYELLWFLKGDTNIKYLLDNGVHIWDGDAFKKYHKTWEMDTWGVLEPLSKESFIDKVKTDNKFAEQWGELGPVYGKQWRKWGSTIDLHSIGKGVKYLVDGTDQIANLIKDLKTDPDSRRLMVNAWNVSEIEKMTLPPCHFGFQCFTYEMDSEERIKEWCDSLGKDISYANDINDEYLDKINFPKRKLSLKWFQRSVDTFLGLPFNIASYGFLLHILAKEVNMLPNELIFSGGDVHIYSNHIEQVKQQIESKTYSLPKLELEFESIDKLKFEDFKIKDYKSSEQIKGSLSN
jgi:thymidylate synthase